MLLLVCTQFEHASAVGWSHTNRGMATAFVRDNSRPIQFANSEQLRTGLFIVLLVAAETANRRRKSR